MANCRKYQAEIRDLKHAIEEMRKEQENLRDVLSQTERRVLAASNEAEEARGLHDMAERQKRQLDNELTSVKENLQVILKKDLFQCFVHPIFLSFAFWYFGHISYMIFVSFFLRLAHLAL